MRRLPSMSDCSKELNYPSVLPTWRSRRAASSLTVAGRFGGTEHEGRVADAYSPRLQHAQVHASEPLDAQVRMIDPAQGPGTEALTKLFAAEMRFRRHFEQR